MSRPPALDDKQKAQVRKWYAAGKTVDEAHALGTAKKWTAGRTAYAKLHPGEDAPRKPAPAPEPNETAPTLADLAERMAKIEEWRAALLKPLETHNSIEYLQRALARLDLIMADPQATDKNKTEAARLVPPLARCLHELQDGAEDDFGE